MKLELNINDDYFFEQLEVALSRVGKGTKKATEAACKSIIDHSNKLVPKETNALMDTSWWEVHRINNRYYGRMTYGVDIDLLNKNSGLPVSMYAVVVHENLEAWHAPGTKAKFLTDAILEYAKKFPISYKRILDEVMKVGAN
jgi:hypothetical protein